MERQTNQSAYYGYHHIFYKKGWWIFAQTYVEIFKSFDAATDRVHDLNNTIGIRVFKVEHL